MFDGINKGLVSATLAISLLITFSSCKDQQEQFDREFTFAFVPFVEYRNQSPPDGFHTCTDEQCEHPVLVGRSDDSLLHIWTAGSQPRSIAISPNRKYLLLSDLYGIQRINENNIDQFNKGTISALNRGAFISDNGDFVSISHIGIQEISGKVAPTSLISSYQRSQFTNTIEQIDGQLVNCPSSPYLISLGDEPDHLNHLYKYNFSSLTFDSNGILDETYIDLPLRHCNSNGFLALAIINNKYHIINITNGIIDSRVHLIDFPAMRYSSNETISESNNRYYIGSYDGVIFEYDKVSGVLTNTWNPLDLLPQINRENHVTFTMRDDALFLIGKNRSNNWILSEFSLHDKQLIYATTSSLLDKIYDRERISQFIIFDVDSFRNWLLSQR